MKGGKVAYLQRQACNRVYLSTAAFCAWLLKSNTYRQLLMTELERVVEYVGENEHGGTTVSPDSWEHIVHVERKRTKKCLVCLVDNDIANDYKDYWSF